MELKVKILLVGSILCLAVGSLIATGVINASLPSLHVILPLGVILGGMFLVTKLFEKESKVPVDDQERALHNAGIHDVPRSETPARQGAIMAQ